MTKLQKQLEKALRDFKDYKKEFYRNKNNHEKLKVEVDKLRANHIIIKSLFNETKMFFDLYREDLKPIKGFKFILDEYDKHKALIEEVKHG